jgi:preprotein translocase subunit SecA
MRIFGSDRLAGMLGTLGMDDDTPIEHKFISSSLESAQKKVEGHNFDSRKQVVEFDDVMNRHRESVYGKRRAALAAKEGMREEIEGMLEVQFKAIVTAHTNQATGEMNLEGLREALGGVLPLTDELWREIERAHPTELVDIAMAEARRLYDEREQVFTPEMMRLVERFVYLGALDRLWINHLEAMEGLREGIFLRSIGQRDPLTEYKREGFRMYKQLLGLFDAEVATNIFRVQIARNDVPEGEAPAEAPVETALTRAAEHARSNAPLEGAVDGSSGGRSRAERRAAAKPVAKAYTGASATKQTNVKRKKKRK